MARTSSRTFILLAVLSLAPLAGLRADVAALHSMAELPRMVGETVAARAKRVVIPPGIYRGAPENGNKTHLTIGNAEVGMW